MRILKTGLAVFVCLLFSFLRSDPSSTAIYAGFTAILSLKENVEQSIMSALSRTRATALGALLGVLAIVIKVSTGMPIKNALYFFIVSALVMFVIWLSVLLNIPESAVLGAIIVLSIALNPKAIDFASGLSLAIRRFEDTFIGIVVTIPINHLLPAKKYGN